MSSHINLLENTLTTIRQALLQARNEKGHWEGKLSGSALSTATAVVALSVTDRGSHKERIEKGLRWLASNQNPDGGWGDTIISPSNISTTTLAWASFAMAEDETRYKKTVQQAEQWIKAKTGSLDAATLADAITACYGEDRTFSVPILTHCAISGRLGLQESVWPLISPLPFEFALAPFWCLKWLRISVVSYALPALIAIGQVRHYHCPPANPIIRFIRDRARSRTLKLLEKIQPSSGGFLEATPLTSFVVMSLASAGQNNNPVTAKGTRFLTASQREDGSWPIDTNLATWGTTLSIKALAVNPSFYNIMSQEERRNITNWLLAQQNRGIHPYTRAGAGGWAWTDLPGGVPDADDTAGALLALHALGENTPAVHNAARLAVKWFLQLQNSDGGIPTFCRGWGKLPFDRSAPDLTAHFLTAMHTWQKSEKLPSPLTKKMETAINKCLTYLEKNQKHDGSWIPLWFGNPHAPNEENPVYGTALVVSALLNISNHSSREINTMILKSVQFLLAAQNDDRGWGGAPGVVSSIEETALTVNTLAQAFHDTRETNKSLHELDETNVIKAIHRGTAWLIEKTNQSTQLPAAPIGLYFARLWYFEKLYPYIFTTQALERVDKIKDSLKQQPAE